VSLHIADAGSRHLCFLSDATVRFVAVAISAPTALMAVTIAAAGRPEFAGFPGAFESEITISWHPEFYYYSSGPVIEPTCARFYNRVVL
jgi:hypothetical protein